MCFGPGSIGTLKVVSFLRERRASMTPLIEYYHLREGIEWQQATEGSKINTGAS
jgi:hypothetical protein